MKRVKSGCPCGTDELKKGGTVRKKPKSVEVCIDELRVLSYNQQVEGVVGTQVRHINRLSKDWYALIDETHIWHFCCMCVFLSEAGRYRDVPAIFIGKGRKIMGIFELLLLAVGLSMDAFAVSVCKGLAMKKISLKNCAVCGVWFGGFQALMPLLGYLLGARFERYIDAIAPWVAFILLALIGGNMIREACAKGEETADAGLDVKTMFLMAVATSIDALAVGITFALVPVKIIPAGALTNTLIAVLIIGITTFAISCAGVKMGNIFGTRYKARAEFTGGVILILLGLKILLGHFGIL
jgi:putative Mn2+ efflux pump MntP